MFYERALQYVEDVQSGKEVACKYVKQAVQRHVDDLANAEKRGIYFDEQKARLYLEAVHLFKHTGGEYAGKPFDAQPFQCFMLMCIFGWQMRESGLRRFKRLYIETAKKSGKSEIAALIVWLCTLLDNEAAAQCYSIATTRDQALHVFRACQIMAKYLRQDSHALRRMIKSNKIQIYIEETETFIKPLASEYSTLDGINTHIGVIDECHAHDTSHVSDTIRNSMVVRQQPLHVQITTAGFNLQGPCFRVWRDEAVKVLSGITHDDALWSIIYTLDTEDTETPDDWNDPTLWPKANPNIGRTVKMANMVDLYNAAKNGGSTREVDFKTKNLNIWVHSQYNWITDELFMKNKGEYSLQDQSDRGVMCWGGMDLGQVNDLTNVALLFDPAMNGGKFIFELYTWTCEEALAKAEEKGYPYRDWQREGYLDVTPGNTTDYGYIENRLRELRTKHYISSIAYDRAMAIPTVINLTYDGFEMSQFNQGIVNMNAPTRTLEQLFLAESVVHDGNPVMRFMFKNVLIIRDSTGNIKITKKDPDKKVDGAVAMVMALGEYLEWQKVNGGLYQEGIKFI